MNRLHALCEAIREDRPGNRAKIPLGSAVLWGAFIHLSNARSMGQAGPNPVSFAEIEAYCRVMRMPLEPHHVGILLAMDDAWLKKVSRGGAIPEGVKTLPVASDHSITPAMFDLVLR
jgi:hypothetical protein